MAADPQRAVGRSITVLTMRIQEFRQHLRDAGAKPCHEGRILRAWLAGEPLAAMDRLGRPGADLPAGVRTRLPTLAAELAGLARIHDEHHAEDGSARWVVTLADGQMVESVLLPRDGLCVSTQVGCAVGCVFCMTGREGLVRQVGSAEIAAQVVLARSRRKVGRVVFMGMGEPSHNLENVLEAIQALGQKSAIAHKNLVFSTVGDLRVFERLPLGPVKPALAISLHSTLAERRAELLPRAPRISPEELVALGEAYARRVGHPIQYQWALIDGVNDGTEELAGMARLLAGKHAMMNLIPYNQVPGLPFRRPPGERVAHIVASLRAQGIVTTVRQSAGQDVDGGCGQLRARSQVLRGPRPRGTLAA